MIMLWEYQYMKRFFYKIVQNFLGTFTGKNTLLHILAIILTLLLVMSGIDWAYFVAIHSSSEGMYLWPAIALGGIVPILLPLSLFLFARIRKNHTLYTSGFAIAQAALLGLVISSLYKVFTGRVPPMRHMQGALTDISHQFQFGFMRGGVFWGWPSSHTTIAFAMMTALIMLYPKKRNLHLTAFFYAFYVGLGVTVGIHWFSEFIAGALIGTAIGTTVGRSFLISEKA